MKPFVPFGCNFNKKSSSQLHAALDLELFSCFLASSAVGDFKARRLLVSQPMTQADDAPVHTGIKRPWSQREDDTLAELLKLVPKPSWERCAELLHVSVNAARERSRYLNAGTKHLQKPTLVTPETQRRFDGNNAWIMPPGHEDSWGAITRGTCLHGLKYPIP